MKKFKIVFLIICLTLSVALLCSCSDEQKVDKALANINKSLGSARTVTQTVTVTDEDVTVYSLNKTLAVNGNKVNVTATEGKLSQDFTLQQTTTETEQDKSALALPVNLVREDMSLCVLTKDALTCSYAKENAAKLFASDTLDAAGDVSVICKLSGNKLLQLDCSFETTSGKTVTLSVTCEY